MHQGTTQGNHSREGSLGSRKITAAQEQDSGIHYVEWPDVLSAVDRQKLLQGKLQRAAQYIAARRRTVAGATEITDVK